MLRSLVLAVLGLASWNALAAEDPIEEMLVVGQLEETIPLQLAEYGNRVEIITAEDIELGASMTSAKACRCWCQDCI